MIEISEIFRTQQLMGLITEDNRRKLLVSHILDPQLGRLTTQKSARSIVLWKNESGRKVFRTHFSDSLMLADNLGIIDCDFYRNYINDAKSFFNYSKMDADQELLRYMNEKYSDFFSDEPLDDVYDTCESEFNGFFILFGSRI